MKEKGIIITGSNNSSLNNSGSKGGSVINTGALSYEKLVVRIFPFLTQWLRTPCKEREISFSNNIQFSDFIDDKYFLGNERLKDPILFKEDRF